ncbi:MAG: dephospho-CoA kinase [SAR202 cluster bacterium]|nr:dephospho-CoA kinase [SAR202 cluster bacterium]
MHLGVSVFVIGLTGGIGTGKTEVTHVLRDLGAVIIESDKVAHLSYRPGTDAYEEIVEQFGKEVIDDSGVIDRAKLGGLVFADPDLRIQLETIVWPAVRGCITERLIQEKERGTKIIVIEVPKLFEAGWEDLADSIWTVEAPSASIAQRVNVRSNLSETQKNARVQAQMTKWERAERADLLIENSAELVDLRERITNLWRTNPEIQNAINN